MANPTATPADLVMALPSSDFYVGTGGDDCAGGDLDDSAACDRDEFAGGGVVPGDTECASSCGGVSDR